MADYDWFPVMAPTDVLAAVRRELAGEIVALRAERDEARAKLAIVLRQRDEARAKLSRIAKVADSDDYSPQAALASILVEIEE